MSELLYTLEAFHFLSPWWLAIIPSALFLWWRIRSRVASGASLPPGIAPHLAAALTVGAGPKHRFLPIDGTVLVVVLLAIGAASPTWSRIPNPLVADTAPLAIAFEVSESMAAPDVAPSRLERAKQKLLDLTRARAGARTALIAYGGTAHRVAPLTEDPAVLKLFIEGLSPAVMPSPGQNATAALKLARAAMSGEETPGAILFVLDDLDPADLPAFRQHAEAEGPAIVFLSVAGADAALGALSRVPDASVVRVSVDEADIAEIERKVAAAYRAVLDRDDRQKWNNRGWILGWLAFPLVLIWFRQGWTMRWAGAVVFALSLAQGGPARADGIADWFLTPDQQGWLAYRDRRFPEAAERFENPMWRGYSMLRAGAYEDAAAVFARLETADAALGEGLALIRSRNYRGGVAAFEKALTRDPSHAAAARNLDVARALVAYVESAREHSDTGEETGIGADDVVFDNESGRGADTEITAESEVRIETSEQWMQTVDTRAQDFLRTRFALEVARQKP